MTEEKQTKYKSLGLAVQANDVEGAKEVVETLKEQKRYIDAETWTELLFKCMPSMTPEMALYLRESGADITASMEVGGASREERGMSISLGFAAVMANNKVLVDWMLDQKWITQDKMLSPSGDTVLMQAIREHAFEVAQMFMDKGMSIDHQNMRGLNQFHEAANRADYLVLEWLMERGADPTLETYEGAIPSEMVPTEAEDPQEADNLFEAIEEYTKAFKSTPGYAGVPAFIATKAKELRPAEEKPEESASKPSPKM